MNKNVENRIINIFWFPWGWKTLMWVVMASHYDRIYSNVDIFWGKRKISKSIKNTKEIKKIKYNDKKGVILLDEMWWNWNSRKSMSDNNIDMWNVAFLSRKLNVDVIFIAQLDYSIDKYFRDLAQIQIVTSAIYNSWKKVFQIETSSKRHINQKNRNTSIKQVDLIKFLELKNIRYDTLENSQLEKENYKKNKLINKS